MDYDAKAREKAEAEMHLPGRITSHTSEPDGGLPDVGLTVGLGGGRFLWCGEISRDQWEEYGAEAAALGSDGGFWLILYTKDGSHVLGKLLDDLEAPECLTDAIARALREAVEEKAKETDDALYECQILLSRIEPEIPDILETVRKARVQKQEI